MTIEKKYLDFIMSSDDKKEYLLDKYNSGKLKPVTLEKKHLKNPNLVAIYFSKQEYDNPFSDYVTKYLCTFDLKNMEILHITNDNLYNFDDDFINGTYPEVSEKQFIISKIKKEVEQAVINRMEKNADIYLSKVNIKDYESLIVSKYKKQFTNSFPENFVDFNLDFNIINEYFTDKNKFIEEMSNKFYTEENIKMFTDYIAIEKGYKDYIDEIDNNVYKKAKDEILKIITDDKYKNIKIYYTNPDKTQSIDYYGKQEHRFSDQKSAIIDKDKFDNIPIKAIDKIIWSRSTLYQKTEEMEKEFDYDEKSQVEDFIKLSKINNLPDWVYNDKDYGKKMYDSMGVYAFEKLNDNLLNDKSYISSIINDNEKNTLSILLALKKSNLMNDKNFIMFALNKINNICTTTECLRIAEHINPDLLKDKDVVKKIIEFKRLSPQLLNQIDNGLLNNKEIVNTLAKDPIDNDFAKEVIPLFNTSENLLQVFTKDKLQKYLSYIQQSILVGDKALLLTLLDDLPEAYGSKLFDNSDNYYFSLYKDDKEVMDAFIKHISDKESAQYILDELDINPKNDIEKIYELASNNIKFLSVLNENEQKVYYDGEINELQNIKDIDLCRKHICIESAFGMFDIKYNNFSTSNAEFYDINGHRNRVPKISYEFEQTIIDYLNKYCGIESDTKTVGNFMLENGTTLHDIYYKTNDDIDR